MLTLGIGFEGISSAQSPPTQTLRAADPIGAVGPDSYIQAVNRAVAIYDKETGLPLPDGGITQFDTFFASVASNVTPMLDPVVVYNDSFSIPKFGVGAIEKYTDPTSGDEQSRFYFAISEGSTPETLTDADWDFFSYDTNDRIDASGTPVDFVFADFPKIGYNADGFVISFLMFVGGNDLDHSSVLGISENGTPSEMRIIGSGDDFVFGPASQHGASPGDPMWFVQDGHNGLLNPQVLSVGDAVTVVRLNNPFSSDPVDVQSTVIPVDDYYKTPFLRQPGPLLTPRGNRFNFSSLRTIDGVTHLVSTFAAGVVRDESAPLDPIDPLTLAAAVKWFDFDVTGATPTLIQEGTVNPDPMTIDTYMPSVALAPDGTIGLNYLQSSDTEFISMNVTAHRPNDAPGSMRTPEVAKTSLVQLQTGLRVGDYSFTAVDPVDGTFWAVNEYATDPTGNPDAIWGTWIQQFDYSPPTVTGVIIRSTTADQTFHPPYDFRTATYDDGSSEPPLVIGTGFQIRTVPVAAADTIDLVFSEPVPNLTRDDLRVVSLASGQLLDVAPGVNDFNYDEPSNTASWKIPNWPAKDNYAIILDDAFTDNHGFALDGEWTNPDQLLADPTDNDVPYTNSSISSFPSGDGEEDGTFAFIITLLGGDADLNNFVQVSNDGFILVGNLESENLTFTEGDFSGDGNVEVAADGFVFVANLGLNLQVITILGDVNNDGIVNDADLAMAEMDEIDVNLDGLFLPDDLEIIENEKWIKYV